jgi:hydrogenase nickel incorporation protein HypB
MIAEPRLVEVRKNVLKQNDIIARALRERFREAGVLAVRVRARRPFLRKP